MSEMVDRGALAMVRATAKHYGDPMPTNKVDLSLTRLLVIAVIEAMREPTETMLAAGDDVMGEGYGALRQGWRAMIDAAL